MKLVWDRQADFTLDEEVWILRDYPWEIRQTGQKCFEVWKHGCKRYFKETTTLVEAMRYVRRELEVAA